MSIKLALAISVFLLTAASGSHAQVGALQTDCKLGGNLAPGSYQFVATCAGRAVSPNGKFAVVQKAYDDNQPPIQLQDARGRTIKKLPTLSDDMPFLVMWSPDSHWFAVNHHVGSYMDELQVFEIVGRSTVERTALVKAVQREAVRRYPCLPRDMVHPNAIQWSGDSRRLILYTVSRLDTCTEWSRRKGTFKSLIMVGNVTTGRIDPKSVHIVPDDAKMLPIPKDGPYSGF